MSDPSPVHDDSEVNLGFPGLQTSIFLDSETDEIFDLCKREKAVYSVQRWSKASVIHVVDSPQSRTGFAVSKENFYDVILRISPGKGWPLLRSSELEISRFDVEILDDSDDGGGGIDRQFKFQYCSEKDLVRAGRAIDSIPRKVDQSVEQVIADVAPDVIVWSCLIRAWRNYCAMLDDRPGIEAPFDYSLIDWESLPGWPQLGVCRPLGEAWSCYPLSGIVADTTSSFRFFVNVGLITVYDSGGWRKGQSSLDLQAQFVSSIPLLRSSILEFAVVPLDFQSLVQLVNTKSKFRKKVIRKVLSEMIEDEFVFEHWVDGPGS
jgi:hypothetical protein